MDASSMPPPQEKTINNHRHIPAEIVEEILLNLPLKSLLRFSSVSESWNSIIFESRFVKRYGCRSRSRAGRERIALVHGGNVIMEKASSCLISSISSNNPTVIATDFDCPFSSRHDQYTIVASCDDLWLARSRPGYYNGKSSLFLWNPSMRRYKKLPNPSSSFMPNKEIDTVFGLGYECVGDDYKILKIIFAKTTREFEAQLYSLRSDSWRSIEDFPTNIGRNRHGDCAFVSGKLHLQPNSYPPQSAAITCFDLLTDKFEEVALPNYYHLELWDI